MKIIELNRIYNGDALSTLNSFPDNSINCCITSPPYYGLRDYGTEGQLGLEPTPEEYVNKLVEVFREVKRVLRDDGTFWLNIGDSYAGSGKGAWLNKDGQKEVYVPDADSPQCAMPKVWDGVKNKDMIGIPWMLAFALRADGWYLRSDIIWQKNNAMPSSVKDRPTSSYEHIFLLSKNKRYHYDADAIKEPCSESNIKDFQRRKTLDNKGKGDDTFESVRPDLNRNRDAYMPSDFRRNKRDVWMINTKPYKGAHFAVFPEALVEPCILAGCPEGGIVLDPFFGSGTVGVVAKKLNRNYIGIDINGDYCELAERRIG